MGNESDIFGHAYVIAKSELNSIFGHCDVIVMRVRTLLTDLRRYSNRHRLNFEPCYIVWLTAFAIKYILDSATTIRFHIIYSHIHLPVFVVLSKGDARRL